MPERDPATLTISERADALEARMSDELDALIVKSNLYTSGETTRARTARRR